MRIFSSCVNTLAIILVLSFHFSNAQSIHFSDSLGPANVSNGYLRIIGSLNGNILLLKGEEKKEFMELLIFDTSCNLITKKQLTFIPIKKLRNVELYNNLHTCDLIWQTFDEGSDQIFFARINEWGEIHKMKKIIVDQLYDKYLPVNRPLYSTIESSNHRFYMIYSMKYDSIQSKKYFVSYRIDSASMNETASENEISYNPLFEQLSKPYIDEEGNIYLARYDNARNYRLGSSISVLKINLDGNITILPTLYSKQMKPQEFYFFMLNDTLTMGALYTDFYSHTTGGLCSFSYNFTNTRWDSAVYFPFSNTIKKQIHKNIFGISKIDLMNLLRLSFFEVKNAHQYSFLFNLECPQYPDRGTNDPDNPRNNNYRGENLPNSTENPVPKNNTVITGGAARNFWGPNYSTSTAPSFYNTGNDPDQKEVSKMGNLLPRPNPTVQKTILYKQDLINNNLSYNIVNSVTTEDMAFNPPLSIACADSLIQFGYSLTPDDKLKLTLSKAGPFIQKKNKLVISTAPRLLLLKENAWTNLEAHKLIAIFLDNEKNTSGICSLRW